MQVTVSLGADLLRQVVNQQHLKEYICEWCEVVYKARIQKKGRPRKYCSHACQNKAHYSKERKR